MKLRQVAWILILIVDLGYVGWGAMAAVSPDGLLGQGGKAILPAGYEGYTGDSWPELMRTSPMVAKYMIVLFRTYGIYNVVIGLLGSAIAVTAFRRGDRWAWWALLVGNTIALVGAMRYDWIVNGHRAFRGYRIRRSRTSLGSARRHRSIPRCRTAVFGDRLNPKSSLMNVTKPWNRFTLPI